LPKIENFGKIRDIWSVFANPVTHILDMHVTWPHVVTSNVHVTCMLQAQRFE